MATLEIRGINKSYGSTQVIKGIDLTIQDEEFMALVGPSGCGKSTLLRMVAGLEDITDGEILIDGNVVNDLASKDRDIAMVFQNYALYPHMSVYKNLAFSLKIQGNDTSFIDERVKWAANLLGLDDLLDRRPKQLSGGQRQRVAMGRAIVRNPKVFLFDEPLSNLDAKLRVQMRTELRELQLRLRTTTIYVTHDQVEAMTMADRICVMQYGKVAQVGRPLDIYDHPVDRFVAGFIGSPEMNFISGLLSGSGSLKFHADDGTRIPVAKGLKKGKDKPLFYGIRPEHFELADSKSGIESKVIVVEPMGAETLVYSSLAGQKVLSLFSDRYDIRPGETIYLRPDVEKVHFFDKITGRNIDL